MLLHPADGMALPRLPTVPLTCLRSLQAWSHGPASCSWPSDRLLLGQARHLACSSPPPTLPRRSLQVCSSSSNSLGGSDRTRGILPALPRHARLFHSSGPSSKEHLITHCWSRYCVRSCIRAAGATGAVLPETGLVKAAGLTWSDKSAALKLQRIAQVVWEEGKPESVFVVKKPNSAAATAKARELCAWLAARGLRVLVERPVSRAELPEYEAYDPHHDGPEVDFCVTLGGDGTVLHLASLFTEDEPLPPVISFAMGTLGFLTPFDASDFRACLGRVLGASEHPVFCTLRTRKRCEVYWNGELQRVHHVLNECLVDRGASPNMVQLECFIDDFHVTTVQADGLIIATPSGSTAYSMSAGGPMVAPSVPCTLLTPIAPHSLSFRPLVVPESSDIEIHLPPSARSHARASFDGRHTLRMLRDSSIRCTTSACALPMINLGRLDADWYEGIVQKLKWNIPIRESSLPIGRATNGTSLSDRRAAAAARALAQQAAEQALGASGTAQLETLLHDPVLDVPPRAGSGTAAGVGAAAVGEASVVAAAVTVTAVGCGGAVAGAADVTSISGTGGGGGCNGGGRGNGSAGAADGAVDGDGAVGDAPREVPCDGQAGGVAAPAGRGAGADGGAVGGGGPKRP